MSKDAQGLIRNCGPFPNWSMRAIATLLLVVTVACAHAADSKPNIVYIVADDLGWKDVGFHGSDIKTPNLDALAANGARLEQFYVEPMCTPSRAALMTGRYPFRYGLQTLVIPASGTYGLPTDEWLLPQALKAAGYDTAIVGKWHLGHADQKFWPKQRGFDYHYGPLIGEIDYFTHKAEGVVDWYRNNQVVNEEGYSTALLGDDAVKLIDAHDAARPLFLYLTFNAPHTPYQAPQDYLDRYRQIDDPSRRLRRQHHGDGRPDRSRRRRARKETHARQHPHHFHERQWRHPQRDVHRCHRRCLKDQDPLRQRPLPGGEGHQLRRWHTGRGNRQLARSHPGWHHGG